MCTSDYNQIEFPTPCLPSCLFPTSTCTQTFFRCLLWYYKTSARAVLPFCRPILSTPKLFLLSSDIFIFRRVGSNAFAATAFMNTIDTNHLQVISQGGELNSQISLEVAVWKRSHFLCLLFYILPIFLVFSSSSTCRLLTDSKKHERYFWRTRIVGYWVCNN